MLAAAEGHKALCDYLIINGADILLVDSKGLSLKKFIFCRLVVTNPL